MSGHRRVGRALAVGVLLPAALATAALGGGALGAGALNAGALSAGALNAGALSAGALNAGALSAGALNAGALNTGAPGAETLSSYTSVAQREGRRASQDRFQHVKHANVFPLCTTCHAGVVEAGQPMWPEPARCEACHDGVVKPRITWQPRTGPRAGNRRFTHEAHSRAATAKNPADSALIRNCAACHNERGAPRMAVRHAVVGQCIDCHGFTAPHVDVPSEACATCHVPVTQAAGLTREDIARFPKPRSHDAPGFLLGGHGKAAKGPGNPGTPRAVAASCATCHAQNFCVTCHVNAPELPEVRALALDDRSPAFTGSLPAPPSHASAAFLRTHGREAGRATATCSSCHARESCTSCHIGTPPRAVAALPAAGPGRARGVHIVRAAPPSHTREFTERHGAEASARPTSCETCHVRAMCLDCHRPDGAGRADARQQATGQEQSADQRQAAGQRQSVATRQIEGTRRSSFHPRAFLTRHPSSAYAREANCSDCHNAAQFCQSCHQQSGLVATSRLGLGGYHDAFRGFSLGHGQAARQSLESCASCHAERDCTACHSAVAGGFRFNPHGPGFNASRARSKNPSLCVACHGRAIPGG